MKIQRLYIGDFGILRNQALEDLHPGIVVIGGPNRAGKSTLMQVLRYLGYGFPQGRGLPPASSKYEAEADIRLDIGDIYNLKLNGYGQPMLNRISGTEKELIDAKELYAIDEFTYGQLFTITLDQLNRNYDMSKDERRRLTSLLLGAGYSDMLVLPQLEENFYREGDRIGGKRGSPKVKQFKPYYNEIEKGQELKAKGLAQVDLYRQRQQELGQRLEEIGLITEEIEELNSQVIRLDVIKNNYDSYLEMERLEGELVYKEEYNWQDSPPEYELKRLDSLGEEYMGLDGELKEKEIELGLEPKARDLLMDRGEDIARHRSEIWGIRERLRQWTQRGEEYDRKKRDLIHRIEETNGNWDEGHIEEIASINTDNIEHNRLSEMVEEYRDLKSQQKDHLDDLTKMKEDFRALGGQGKDKGAKEPWAGVKGYFYFSLGFILLGVILSFINPLSGLILGIGGALGAAVHLIIRAWDSKENLGSIKDQEERLKKEKAKMHALEKIIENLKTRLSIVEEELERTKEVLGLPSAVSHSLLPGHLLRIKDIQARILELEEMSEEMDRDKGYLRSQYARYISFLNGFSPGEIQEDHTGQGYNEEDWNRVDYGLGLWSQREDEAQEIRILEKKLGALEKAIMDIMERYEPIGLYENGDDPYDDLYKGMARFMDRGKKAVEYNRIEADLKAVIHSILSSMGSDGIRRAFGYYESPEAMGEMVLIKTFKEKCRAYGSREEAQEDYQRVSKDRDRKWKELEDLKESRQRLEEDLERLRAVENLNQGQRQIHNARAQLRTLAEEYAINMTAAFLLKEVGQNLLEGMKGDIMDSAGNIFSRMTKGYYKGILPSEPLLEADFEAVLYDEASPQTIDMLSRGTREQLYLSVRLGRIMDIKPNLPIIIDDSFANFDSMHLAQSIDILSELAATHQIFILTCHGELVDEISRSKCKAQYWKLDRGRLEIRDHKELSSFLSG